MVQPVTTKDYGKVHFTKVFYGMADREASARGGSVGILQNGTWAYFPSAHPIKDIQDARRIVKEVSPTYLSALNDWWEHREEMEMLASERAVRSIRINADETLTFDDSGEEVEDVASIYEYFPRDSAILEMALQLFTQSKQRREKQEAHRLLSKMAEPEAVASPERVRSGRPAPVSAEEAKAIAERDARSENLEKARAVRAANLAKKKAEEAKE